MKLTGKAKIDFEMWYFNKFCNSGMEYHELLPHHMNDVFGWFYGLDGSFKWGVYVDFFNGKGLILMEGVKWDFSGYISFIERKNENIIYSNNSNPVGGFVPFETREESRKAVIQKANEIYNQRTAA